MTASGENHAEMADLVEALCHGEITPEAAARLEALVCEDKAARQYYIRYMHLHANLPQFHTESGARDDLARLHELLEEASAEREPAAAAAVAEPAGRKQPPASNGVGRRRSPWIARAVSGIALGGAMAALILLLLAAPWVNSVFNPEDGANRPDVVAWVTGNSNVQWGEGQQPHEVGGLLRPGDYVVLEEGLAEVTFRSGARVTLQGPVTFRIDTAMIGQLHSGLATAVVPPAAHGFAIDTATVRVIDLGTEFGLHATPSGILSVHVFQGKVAAVLEEDGITHERYELVADESAQFDMQGRLLKRNAPVEDRFAKALEFAKRGSARSVSRDPQKESELHAKLQQYTDVDFRDTPLEDAVKFLADKHDLPLVLDRKALQAASLRSDLPITLKRENLPLNQALDLALSPHGLKVIVQGEQIVVTAAARDDE